MMRKRVSAVNKETVCIRRITLGIDEKYLIYSAKASIF